MTMHATFHSHTASCPAASAKAVVSCAYTNAVRYASALRFYYFYYYYYYCHPVFHLKRVSC